MKKNLKCIEINCLNKVWNKNTRCFSCYTIFKKGKNNPNYKYGKSLLITYCLKCNKKLSRTSSFLEIKLCRSCSKKGKKLSEEHKLKIRNTCKKTLGTIYHRKKMSKILRKVFKDNFISRLKMSKSKRGIKNNKYIDGRTDLRKRIRSNIFYSEWRTKCFQRDNYTCQSCSQVGGRLVVDHIEPFCILLNNFLKKYNQFSPVKNKEILVNLAVNYKNFWDINNGITLCKKCNLIKTKEDWNKGKYLKE